MFGLAHVYIDIPLNITRGVDHVSYNLPIKISELDYRLTISLGGPEEKESILSPQLKASLSNNKKHKIKKFSAEKELTGTITATSLEGYSFEGWRRFFLEVFLYISQRYYHDIKVDLSEVRQIQEGGETQPRDGLVKFGPSPDNNKIYKQIKANTEYIDKDYVAIYRGISDKNARIQLGGYE